MLLAMKDEPGSNLNNDENDFMLDNSYGEETMEELTAAVMLMARIQPADGNAETVPSYDAKAVSEVNASSKVHEQVTGLGYKNPERLKKAIAAQPKMYDGELLYSAKLNIHSPDSEETLEDAEEIQLKIRNKIVQINYAKLNALYEIFVPQQEFSVEQIYFSIPSTSNNGSKSKEHQKEKMACDVSWKSKFSAINDENVLLKTQVESVIQERENIKLQFQKLFNLIKATQAQHQKEVDELIKHVNQKTYAYADVRAQNQDLLITISELKNKLQIDNKGKNVNTKFDKSETSRTLLYVTPLPKNITVKAKKMSNSKVKA
ncbi:hypothetical protein Tco_1449795 [Tanacetum coccineum]